MDKTKYRKENGKFVRRVGPLELESYILHVIDNDGVMNRVINPPEDVVGILLEENKADEDNPNVDFEYSIKQLANKYWKPKSGSSKSGAKFGLHEFAKLFADAEKSQPRRPINMLSYNSFIKVEMPKYFDVKFKKNIEKLLVEDARKRWEQCSKDLCPCKKKQILQQIKHEHEQAELQQLIMRAMIISHESYGSMLLEQLDRGDTVMAFNLGGEKKGTWTLEKKQPRMGAPKMMTGKKEFWRK